MFDEEPQFFPGMPGLGLKCLLFFGVESGPALAPKREAAKIIGSAGPLAQVVLFRSGHTSEHDSSVGKKT